MAVNIDVSGAPDYRPGTIGAAQGPGRVARAVRAVLQSIYGNPEYVTDGIADLDAKGEISALNDRHRENAVNALRAIAREARSARAYLDAAADVIERGPVDPEPVQELPAPVKRTRRKAA